MKLKDLFEKYQNTGRDGVVITDAELRELKKRLEEVQELFTVWNPFDLPLLSKIHSIEDMLDARKRHGRKY